MSIVITNARVLTMAGDPGPRSGTALGKLGIIPRAEVVVEGDEITSVIDLDASSPSRHVPRGGPDVTIDAGGHVLMPGFVDAHTHACWAGDRIGEWQQKLAGAGYLDILRSGGGIMSTVRAVRAASEEALTRGLLERLNRMLLEGTTTVEVKSGYGLSTIDELKMLRAIHDAADAWPGTIVPTALIGHALDPQQPGFIQRTIGETLPAVSAEFPGITIDAYCESGAWSFEDTRTLFEGAMHLGHPVRVHTDQFNELGMTEWCIEHSSDTPQPARCARSVDHLEATSLDVLERVAGSPLYAVMLPCSGFHVDGRYADGRTLLDAGGRAVIATNYNPGSAPCPSMCFAIALATRFLGMTPQESIGAATVNPASLLGLTDRGVLARGMRADLVLLRHNDERMLAFEFGGNPVDRVIVAGQLVGA